MDKQSKVEALEMVVIHLQQRTTNLEEAIKQYIKENPDTGYYSPKQKHAAWIQRKAVLFSSEPPEKEGEDG